MMAPAVPHALINDTFTGANGSSVNASLYNTAVYAAGNVQPGSGTTIQGNQLSISAGAIANTPIVSVGITTNAITLGTQRTFEFDVTNISPTGDFAFILTLTTPMAGDTQTFPDRMEVAFSGGSRYIQIFAADGSSLVYNSGGVIGFEGTTHSYKMVVTATQISFYQDAVLITTQNHGKTIVNLFAWFTMWRAAPGLATNTFDNFKVS